MGAREHRVGPFAGELRGDLSGKSGRPRPDRALHVSVRISSLCSRRQARRTPWRICRHRPDGEIATALASAEPRIFQLRDLFRTVFSATGLHDAVATILRQSEPADFDGAGVRVWQGQEEIVRKLGGPGTLFRRRLPAGNWRPWMVPPKLIHCFSDPDTGATAFDPFRLILRRAYAEGTDLRLFVTPNQAAIRRLFHRGRPGRALRVLAERACPHQRERGRPRRASTAAALGLQRSQHDHA